MKRKVYNECYEKVDILGKGSFGSIFKARVLDFDPEKKNKATESTNAGEELKSDEIAKKPQKNYEFVAIKKIESISQKGVDYSFLREVKVLKELGEHPNIIKVVDVFVSKKKTYMAMEVMKMSLHDLAYDERYQLTESDIKCIAFELLTGLEFLHRNSVMHRDMKPSNMLISEDGQIKLSDFGLARYYEKPAKEMTGRVTTRGYKPPELLYGSKLYGPSIDIWSTACIIVEMYLKKPIFYADNDIGQLSKIFSIRGSPNEENWPEVNDLPSYLPFEHSDKVPFTKVIPDISAEGADLLDKMLDINPNRRITAEKAQKHPFFETKPSKSEATYQKYVKEYQKPKRY